MACGIIRSRGAAWVPSKHTWDFISKTPNKLINITLKTKRQSEGTSDQFNPRRNRKVKQYRGVCRTLVHTESASSWLAHVQRHPEDHSFPPAFSKL
eukprot:9050641-Pyramimonas_sp.AAC.1